ncbi:conserved hypothetical protein [Alteromonas macleodii]
MINGQRQRALAFFSSPIHLPVSKVSLHHSYGRYFDSDFSTNVEAAIVKLALSVAIIVASYQRRSLSKPK